MVTTGRRFNKVRAAAVVDPALPQEVRETVHRIGRQHPHLLREPDAPLPWAAALDTAELGRGVRASLVGGLALVVLSPALFWLQSSMERNLGGHGPVSTGSYRLIIGAVLCLGVAVNMARTWFTARVPGGRQAVAEHLATARGHYLLRGDDLTPEAWNLTIKAHRAVESVLISTWLLSAVDRPNRDALEKGIWTMARSMAGGAGTAAAQTFVAAVEVYGKRISEANEIGLTLLGAGENTPKLAKAVARANEAGAHALAMAAG